MTKPTMTVEEARAWFESNKARLREQLADMVDPPAELTPDGRLLGPTSELQLQRLIRALNEPDNQED